MSHYAILRGYIATANADGTIPIAARVVAQVSESDMAQANMLVAQANAAGDLLAALIRLRDLDVNCSQQEDRAAWEQAHAAIARAEGK